MNNVDDKKYEDLEVIMLIKYLEDNICQDCPLRCCLEKSLKQKLNLEDYIGSDLIDLSDLNKIKK